MLVEAYVLRCHGSLNQTWSQILVIDIGAVLDVEGGQHLAVLCKKLSSKLVVRMFQFLERRNLCEYRDEQHCNEQYCYRSRYNYPEPLDYFLSCIVSHLLHQFRSQTTKLKLNFEFVLFCGLLCSLKSD